MNLLKPFGTESFVIGIGIAAVSYLFGPTIKRGAREVAVKGMQGALMAGDTASHAVESGREKFSSFIHNMMHSEKDNDISVDKSFHKELVDELKEDRQQQREFMKELMSTMKSLKNEVKELKNTAQAQVSKATSASKVAPNKA